MKGNSEPATFHLTQGPLDQKLASDQNTDHQLLVTVIVCVYFNFISSGKVQQDSLDELSLTEDLTN